MFWRNEFTANLNPGESGQQMLDELLERMRHSGRTTVPDALEMLFRKLPACLQKQAISLNAHSTWWVQDIYHAEPLFRLAVCLEGCERAFVDSVVGGGLSLWMETNGHLSAEISIYYHRLVCTNGMIRKVEGAGRIEAWTMSEWDGQLDKILPSVLQGISTGLDTLHRSAQVRLGILWPVMPVVLDYLEVRDPFRMMILEAFRQEPGDTLWHFINAFSRAANSVMIAEGIPREVASQKCYQLQHASVRICDAVLEGFSQGGSLLDIASNLKGLLDMGSDTV